MKTNCFESRAFVYLDIISWLQAKIKDVPVQQVIFDKFKKETQIKVTTPPIEITGKNLNLPLYPFSEKTVNPG